MENHKSFWIESDLEPKKKYEVDSILYACEW